MKLKFKGLEVNTNANLPKKKTKAPDFCLVDKNLSIVSLSDFRGKRVILNAEFKLIMHDIKNIQDVTL